MVYPMLCIPNVSVGNISVTWDDYEDIDLLLPGAGYASIFIYLTPCNDEGEVLIEAVVKLRFTAVGRVESPDNSAIEDVDIPAWEAEELEFDYADDDRLSKYIEKILGTRLHGMLGRHVRLILPVVSSAPRLRRDVRTKIIILFNVDSIRPKVEDIYDVVIEGDSQDWLALIEKRHMNELIRAIEYRIVTDNYSDEWDSGVY